MADICNLVLVGHCLESKCDVANAVVQQREAFRPLSCRRKPLVKETKRSTLQGKSIRCIVTPNIDTPAWMETKRHIEKDYNNTLFIFVYVASFGYMNVDDLASMQYVVNVFPKAHIVSIVHCKSANIPVPEEWRTSAAITSTMSFDDKKYKTSLMLVQIAEKLKLGTKTTPSKKVEQSPGGEVGTSKARSRGQPTAQEPISVDRESPLTPVLDDFDIKGEPRLLPLPELTGQDWGLYNKAMMNGMAVSNHVRVNVVGHQGVGKTTLVKRLQGFTPVCPDNNFSSTEALDIDENLCRCTEQPSGRIWEPNIHGLDDLNAQRLAECMKSQTPETLDESMACEEDLDTELMLGSDEIPEGPESLPRSEGAREEMYAAKVKYEEYTQLLQQAKQHLEYGMRNKMYFSFWDFAGQSTYYSTHQAFLSPRAVYLIVFDLSKQLDQSLSDSLSFKLGKAKECTVAESLQFWASSIKTFTSDENGGRAPIILVGTHGDMVDEATAQKRLEEVKDVIEMDKVIWVKVDNTKPNHEDITELRNAVLEVGLGIADESVPARWMELENALNKEKENSKHVITFQDVKRINEKLDFKLTEEGLKAFLEHGHCRGQWMYFAGDGNEDMGLIILKPVVLAKFLNSLMRKSLDTKQKTFNKDAKNANGIVDVEFINKTAAEILFHKENINTDIECLTDVLMRLKIIMKYTYEETNKTVYIMPSLLPIQSPPRESSPRERIPKLKITFDGNFLPLGFFHLFMVALVTDVAEIEISSDDNIPQIFGLHCSLYLKYRGILVDVSWNQSSIIIDIQNFSKRHSLQDMSIDRLIDNIDSVIQNTLEIYRQNAVSYTLSLKCPSCPNDKDNYLSLSALSQDGEVMCRARHECVAMEDITNALKFTLLTQDDPQLRPEPTDKELARLAYHLRDEDASNLATLVSLEKLSAEQVKHDHADKHVQRLQILRTWKNKQHNKRPTLQLLMKRLTRTNSHDINQLKTAIFSNIEDRIFDLSESEMGCRMTLRDQAIVAQHIGSIYPLVFLELGIDFHTIQEVRANQPDMRSLVNELLNRWRQNDPSSNYIRRVLNTMSHYGLPTTEVVKAIKKCTEDC